MAGSPAVTRY